MCGLLHKHFKEENTECFNQILWRTAIQIYHLIYLGLNCKLYLPEKKKKRNCKLYITTCKMVYGISYKAQQAEFNKQQIYMNDKDFINKKLREQLLLSRKQSSKGRHTERTNKRNQIQKRQEEPQRAPQHLHQNKKNQTQFSKLSTSSRQNTVRCYPHIVHHKQQINLA